jgi:hypothetical protein
MMREKVRAAKTEINGRPVPHGLPKEELYGLLASDSMTDFVPACEALSALSDEEACDRLGAYLTHPDKYRRLAVLKVIFRDPHAVKYLPALEEAIASEHILFAENGLRAAYECRMPVSDSVILTATRRHLGELFSLDALDLLTVSEENYRALIEIHSLCVTSLQQEILADILARKYADAHAPALFELFSASRYPQTRLRAVELGLRFSFDLTALRNDPDGHVRRAASTDQNERQILNENRKDK